MAIAFDAGTNVAVSSSVTSLTWSHTCTGSDLILFVACGQPSTDIITGVTYNGVSMTKVGSGVNYAPNEGGGYIYLFYLVNPPTGTHNVVVSASASTTLVGASASYTGVSSNGVISSSTAQGTINSGSNLTGSDITYVDNSWNIYGAIMVGGPFSAGSGTLRAKGTSGGTAYMGLIDSAGVISPPGSASLAAHNGDSVSREMGGIIASFTATPNGLDVRDKTSNANNLTNHSGASTTGELGSYAIALASASSEYLSTPDNSAWKPSPNITLEAWVNYTSLPGAGNYPGIISNLSTTNGLGYNFFYDGDTGHIRFYVQISGSSINVDSTIAPSTGAWHHYAVTFDGSTVKFYLDGSLHDTSSASKTITYESNQNPLIGAVYLVGTGITRYINGSIDDVRIWNLVRSDSDISANYNSQLTGGESGLVAYYPFNAPAVNAGFQSMTTLGVGM